MTSIKFGTSGLRGLVVDFGYKTIEKYVSGFLNIIPDAKTVCIGRDKRESSTHIQRMVHDICMNHNFDVMDCGEIPTPALAYFANQNNLPCIMITGSHVPENMNGIKFYTVHGEITKNDEENISKINRIKHDGVGNILYKTKEAKELFLNRYKSLLQFKPLSGLKIGIYEHSSVAISMLADVIEFGGAEVNVFGKSNTFVSVDTENVHNDVKQLFKTECLKNNYDAIISTDPDGDRPLITDSNGNIIKGDVLGWLVSEYLNVDCVVTPINSVSYASSFNTARTKIGSPYVIEAIENELHIYPEHNVLGFEANGGFIQYSPVVFQNVLLNSLKTRDSFLPIIVMLINRQSLNVIKERKFRNTLSTSIKNVSKIEFNKLLDLTYKYFSKTYELVLYDTRDGHRMSFFRGEIIVIHLRQSGNSDELRIYIETSYSEMCELILYEIECIFNTIKTS